MWQRIQTIYMLLAFVALVLFNFLSTASFTANSNSWFLTPFGLSGNQVEELPTYFVGFGVAINSLAAILIIALLGFFKNRKLQIRLGHASYLLCLGLTVLLYLNLSDIKSALELSFGTVEVSYNVGSYLPVVAIAFLILANRAIKKDEELVKSLDRIR